MFLYAVAVVVLLNCSFSSATVTVISNLGKRNETLTIIEDEQSVFGEDLPEEGLSGFLMYVNPADACTQIERPPKINASFTWIALIVRSNCTFDVKVLNAQLSGYKAAIVYNNQSNNIFSMHGSLLSDNVTIPSVFIGRSDGLLLQQYSNRTNVRILIDADSYEKPVIYFILMGCIGFLGIFVGICIVLINWTCRRAKRRKSLLSKRKLKKLPVHRFKTGDLYDTCAICLDEYTENDKLRILPCAHAFHCNCIDPWLTEKKNTCPLCKYVVGKPPVNSTSINSDETQPLIDDSNEDATVVDGAAASNSAFHTVAEVHTAPRPQRNRGYGALLATPAVMSSVTASGLTVANPAGTTSCPVTTSAVVATVVQCDSPVCVSDAVVPDVMCTAAMSTVADDPDIDRPATPTTVSVITASDFPTSVHNTDA